MSTKFGIFMYAEVEPIDIGATLGVLSMARRVVPSIEMLTVAPTRGEVEMTNGLRVMADYGVPVCPKVDALMVLGGGGWVQESKRAESLVFLHRQPEEAACVDAGRIVTGGDVTLAIDTTLYLLERLFGADKATEIARLIDYSAAREANARSFAVAA